MRYLLGTNLVSDLVRNPQDRVTQHIRHVGEAQVCTSIIVAAELRYGATKRGSPRLTAQVEAVLGALDVLRFEARADTHYGLLRAGLDRAGRPIGGNDMLIAAQAMTSRHTLVTDNEREFARIDGLAWENWLRNPRAANLASRGRSGSDGPRCQAKHLRGGATVGYAP